MHDETFLVTEGMIRFTWHPENASEATKTVDAKAGDYVVVSVLHHLLREAKLRYISSRIQNIGAATHGVCPYSCGVIHPGTDQSTSHFLQPNG